MDEPNTTTLDSLLERAGGVGKFQWISFFILAGMWFVASCLLLGQGFFFDDDFSCKELEGAECRAFVCSAPPAERPTRISWHPSSIVFEFGHYLICEDSAYISTLLQSMVYAGSFVGFLVVPHLADNFGRHPAIILSWAATTAALVLCVAADGVVLIGGGYFLAGLGANPAITLSYSFFNEQCVGKHRQIFGVAVMVFFALGESAIGFLFLAGLQWRYVFIVILALTAAHFAALFYLLESPLFLLSRNPRKAWEVLAIIAGRNGGERPTLSEVMAIPVPSRQQQSILDLFRFASLRWISVASGLVFMGIQVMYYAASLSLGEYGFNRDVNQQIFAFSEMVSYVAAEFLVSWVRRRRAIFWGLLGASLASAVLALMATLKTEANKEVLNWCQTVVLIVNRLVLCGFWSVLYVFLGEVYPATVRSLGLGWASLAGTLGSVLSPDIIFVSDHLGVSSWLPSAVIGFLCLFTVQCLP